MFFIFPEVSSSDSKHFVLIIFVSFFRILIVGIAIIVIVYCICRRRRRRLQILKEQNERPKSRERPISKSVDMKTAELKEDSPKREIKDKRKTKTKENEIDESKKGKKPKSKLIKSDPGPHSFQPPPPGRLVTFEEDVESKSEKRSTAKTQNDATTVETVSTTQQTGPEPESKAKAGLKAKAKPKAKVVENENIHPILKAIQKLKMKNKMFSLIIFF
uniref:Uncharacterized protein n=1 Tax=Panagrolaimus superbus TaxID=310955 RepID=A0A914YAL9_9BILA